MIGKYIFLRPGQLEQKIREFPLALVPFGALEWHSYHLPLGFDGLKAEKLLRQVGERLGKGILFPTMYWGCYDTLKFPFTFHFPRRALQKQIRKFTRELYQMGFRVIVFLTGHYPPSQIAHLRRVGESMMKKHSDLAMLAIPEQHVCMELDYYGDHAGKCETSLGLALMPDVVDLSLLPAGYRYIDRVQFLGIMGIDPQANATTEYGIQLQKRTIDELTTRIQRVWAERSPQAFKEVYQNVDKKVRELKSLKHLDRTVQILGMATKHDMLAHAKWMILKRSKQQIQRSN